MMQHAIKNVMHNIKLKESLKNRVRKCPSWEGGKKCEMSEKCNLHEIEIITAMRREKKTCVGSLIYLVRSGLCF